MKSKLKPILRSVSLGSVFRRSDAPPRRGSGLTTSLCEQNPDTVFTIFGKYYGKRDAAADEHAEADPAVSPAWLYLYRTMLSSLETDANELTIRAEPRHRLHLFREVLWLA